MLFLPAVILIMSVGAVVGNHQNHNNEKHQKTQHPARPNIIFLVVESTDGRTWQRGYQDDVIPLPNLRKLENKGGYSFYKHYTNIPVCCPSRASFWSGKFPHKIQHLHNNMTVNGAWNNYEGLPANYSNKIFDILQKHGNYDIKISGKQDWVSGGHSLNVQLNSWTMYTQFPYNIHKYGGWNEEESMCRSQGTVHWDDIGVESKYWSNDWKNLNDTIDWIRNHTDANNSNNNQPFFAYQGMNIVHPAYVTNRYWFNSIDPQKIHIPEWIPLTELHPCDLQSTMLKGCLPISNKNESSEEFYSTERRLRIRQIYYAMINEFDAMVGRYMAAIDELGLSHNTIFIVMSDHGDMQMEHQQFYKHVPYDASSNVPLIIYDPTRTTKTKTKVAGSTTANINNNNNNNVIINTPTQHVDLFPTIMDFAGIPKTKYPPNLDGYSLLSFMDDGDDCGGDHGGGDDSSSTARRRTLSQPNSNHDHQNQQGRRPDFVVSQLHGVHIAMSWFAIIRPMPCLNHNNHDNGNRASPNRFVRQQRQQRKNQRHDGYNITTPPPTTTTTTTNDYCIMKLVIWGTGKEVESQLFDLTNDPNEMVNLITKKEYSLIIESLDLKLKSVVDYEKVALDVAKYNKQSFKKWIERNPTDWTSIIQNPNLRWHRSWMEATDNHHDPMVALQDWLHSNNDNQLIPCRKELIWPPSPAKKQELDFGILSTNE